MSAPVTSSDALVSVIMPAKDAGRYIGAAIESVIAQDYRCWELLVIDDHSVDQTAKIIKAYAAGDERVVYSSIPANAKGVAAARNHGIRQARGRYIALLDSDDIWNSKKLSIQLATMASRSAALCYCAYRKMYDDGSVGSGTIEVPQSTSYDDLLKSNVIGCSTAIFDTTVVGKVFMPEVATESAHYFEDYALWLRIARKLVTKEESIVGINEPLAIYRVRKGSLSQDKFRAARYTWRVYRRIERISFYKAMYHFCHYALRGFRKYLIR
jgi:teichuronic acid biosynthesis glycosyltransferase TuaG